MQKMTMIVPMEFYCIKCYRYYY